MKISIIIPVFNEAGSIAKLHAEILQVCRSIGFNFEIIFVNDGSTDDSLATMKNLSPAKIINFRRNFGQTAALDAGFKHATGDYLIALDADGQNDPADILKLIGKLEKENFDVVSGWRKNRQDKFFKKISSRAVALLRKILINDGVHDSGCTLKIYRKECFNNLDLFGEMHRFIPAMLKIRGFKIGEIEVNHRPRLTGKTKYNWKRGIKGGLDIFSIWFWKKYANRPLHLFGTVGLVIILISFVSGSLALYHKIFHHADLSDTALTDLSIFAFLIGIQFVVFGLISDLLSKTYYAARRESPYSIKEIIEK